MPDLAVEPTSVAQWQSLVRTAGEACDTRLDEPVEAYVVFMLMRFSRHTALGREALAVRWLEGMQASGGARTTRWPAAAWPTTAGPMTNSPAVS